MGSFVFRVALAPYMEIRVEAEDGYAAERDLKKFLSNASQAVRDLDWLCIERKFEVEDDAPRGRG